MLLSLFAEILTRSALINCGSSTEAFWCHAVTTGRLVSPKRASTSLKNIFAVRPSHCRVRAILPHFTSIKRNRFRRFKNALGAALWIGTWVSIAYFSAHTVAAAHFANNVVFTAAALGLIIVLISFVVRVAPTQWWIATS